MGCFNPQSYPRSDLQPLGNGRILQCYLGLMVAPSFKKKGSMAAELPCTTTAAALRELSGIRFLLYKIANEDIAHDNHSSARLSCVRSFAAKKLGVSSGGIGASNDIRATEKSIQANVRLRCLWTKLVLNLMRERSIES